MRREGWEERLRELNEAAMAMRVAQGAAKNVQGWLRTVRREVGIPAPEAAGRLGLDEREVFRMERAERKGGIALRTLRRAAEALGCDLVYGLAPKEGTLKAMAAEKEAGRVQRKAETRTRKYDKAKDQRREVARKRWAAQEQARLEEEWREYWRQCRMRRTEGARKLIPKPKPQVKLWKQELRKALARVMRKDRMRVR
jgi:predicted DNA-binding mobile mystery protein A